MTPTYVVSEIYDCVKYATNDKAVLFDRNGIPEPKEFTNESEHP